MQPVRRIIGQGRGRAARRRADQLVQGVVAVGSAGRRGDVPAPIIAHGRAAHAGHLIAAVVDVVGLAGGWRVLIGGVRDRAGDDLAGRVAREAQRQVMRRPRHIVAQAAQTTGGVIAPACDRPVGAALSGATAEIVVVPGGQLPVGRAVLAHRRHGAGQVIVVGDPETVRPVQRGAASRQVVAVAGHAQRPRRRSHSRQSVPGGAQGLAAGARRQLTPEIVIGVADIAHARRRDRLRLAVQGVEGIAERLAPAIAIGRDIAGGVVDVALVVRGRGPAARGVGIPQLADPVEAVVGVGREVAVSVRPRGDLAVGGPGLALGDRGRGLIASGRAEQLTGGVVSVVGDAVRPKGPGTGGRAGGGRQGAIDSRVHPLGSADQATCGVIAVLRRHDVGRAHGDRIADLAALSVIVRGRRLQDGKARPRGVGLAGRHALLDHDHLAVGVIGHARRRKEPRPRPVGVRPDHADLLAHGVPDIAGGVGRAGQRPVNRQHIANRIIGGGGRRGQQPIARSMGRRHRQQVRPRPGRTDLINARRLHLVCALRPRRPRGQQPQTHRPQRRAARPHAAHQQLAPTTHCDDPTCIHTGVGAWVIALEPFCLYQA
ncbi:hypothetical protein D3C86_1214720 [compost metagenome]